MKKHLLLLVATVATFGAAFARPIATLDPAISCDLRKMNPDEIEDLLFNEEAAKFMRSSLRGIDGIEFAAHGHTHGHHSVAADTEKLTTIKNLHERFQPFVVTIKNNSSAPITIYKGQYINTLTEALSTYKKIIKFYPNFKGAQTGWTIAAVLCGIVSAGLTIGTLASIGSTSTRQESGLYLGNTSISRARSRTGESISMGISALLMGAMTWMSANIASWASRLKKHKRKLAKTRPVMTDSHGCKYKANKGESFTIQPGESFTETLLVNAQSIQTSSAVFGSVATPELVYIK